jgi:hypothetical protein
MLRSRPISFAGIAFALAVASTAYVIWTAVIPMIDGRGWPYHDDHLRLILPHIAGGVTMITLGSLNVFLGWTGRTRPWHKWIGRAYLFGGTFACALVIVMAIVAPHEPQSLYVATGTLALVWIAVAAMGWRAARNRRFASHREWMIRSYVLSWTFVGCRLATQVDFYPWLESEGVTAAIWVNWIVPLVLCEIALRWKEGAPERRLAS